MHLIIGSGIFGLNTALALRQRGYAVTLLDQGGVPHPDAASTDISKVVRMDYGRDAQHTEMGLAALARWREWNARWGEPLYHEDGFLVMAREAMQPGGFEHDSFHFLSRLGVDLRRVDSAVLAKEFPAWRAERYPDGYLNVVGGWAESGRVVARLKADALAAGVVIHEHAAFAQLMHSDARVTGVVTTDGRRFSGELVIMAMGAWTPHWLPHLAKVMHATGQTVLHFRPQEASLYEAARFPVWAADIGRTGWYGFPVNRDGIVKVANHGVGKRVDPTAARVVDEAEEPRFRDFLRETFPSLAEAPLASSRLCLYCDTFDGAFWIDHDREHPGLFVAAGDSGHAFKFTPVLGDLIADVVEGKPNAWAARYAAREVSASAADGARAH